MSENLVLSDDDVRRAGGQAVSLHVADEVQRLRSRRGRGLRRSNRFAIGWANRPRGDVVLLAWDPGHSLASSPLRRFTPPRNTQSSLLRLDVPVKKAAG